MVRQRSWSMIPRSAALFAYVNPGALARTRGRGRPFGVKAASRRERVIGGLDFEPDPGARASAPWYDLRTKENGTHCRRASVRPAMWFRRERPPALRTPGVARTRRCSSMARKEDTRLTPGCAASSSSVGSSDKSELIKLILHWGALNQYEDGEMRAKRMLRVLEAEWPELTQNQIFRVCFFLPFVLGRRPQRWLELMRAARLEGETLREIEKRRLPERLGIEDFDSEVMKLARDYRPADTKNAITPARYKYQQNAGLIEIRDPNSPSEYEHYGKAGEVMLAAYRGIPHASSKSHSLEQLVTDGLVGLVGLFQPLCKEVASRGVSSQPSGEGSQDLDFPRCSTMDGAYMLVAKIAYSVGFRPIHSWSEKESPEATLESIANVVRRRFSDASSTRSNFQGQPHKCRTMPGSIAVSRAGAEWSICRRRSRSVIGITHCPWCGEKL